MSGRFHVRTPPTRDPDWCKGETKSLVQSILPAKLFTGGVQLLFCLSFLIVHALYKGYDSHLNGKKNDFTLKRYSNSNYTHTFTSVSCNNAASINEHSFELIIFLFAHCRWCCYAVWQLLLSTRQKQGISVFQNIVLLFLSMPSAPISRANFSRERLLCEQGKWRQNKRRRRPTD